MRPERFALEERGVGFVQQPLEIGRARGRDTDAQRRRDRAGRSLDPVGGHGLPEAGRDLPAVRAGWSCDHRDELVTAVPREQVRGTQRCRASRGDDAEHLVAHCVAVPVVDVLEVVDVDHHCRHRLVVPVRGAHDARRHLEELPAIGHTGERIRVREAPQLVHEPLVVTKHRHLPGDHDDREAERAEHEHRERSPHAARRLVQHEREADEQREVRKLAHGLRLVDWLLGGRLAGCGVPLRERGDRDREEREDPECVRERPRHVAPRQLEPRVHDVGEGEEHRTAREQPQRGVMLAAGPAAHEHARDTEHEDHVTHRVREREHLVEQAVATVDGRVDDEVPDHHQRDGHHRCQVERERHPLAGPECADRQPHEPGEDEHVEREIEPVGR